jgi:hypothetical protein
MWSAHNPDGQSARGTLGVVLRLAIAAAALLAVLTLPAGAVGYIIVIAIFALVMLVLDRLLPDTGLPSADAKRAFQRTQRERGGRRDKGNRLPLLDPELEDRASRQARGVQSIPIAAIVGTTEPQRAAAFDRAFRPPAWASGRWQLMWIAARRGASFPPILVYRLGEAYWVRDGHHRVSVARALGAVEIEARVVELRAMSDRGSNR